MCNSIFLHYKSVCIESLILIIIQIIIVQCATEWFESKMLKCFSKLRTIFHRNIRGYKLIFRHCRRIMHKSKDIKTHINPCFSGPIHTAPFGVKQIYNEFS